MTLRSIVRVLGLLREASAQTSAAASSRPANKESTMTKVLVLYYSSHGHIEEMAYAAAEGIRSVGVEAIEKRRSEEHTSELQSLMHTSYTVFWLKKKNILQNVIQTTIINPHE